MNKILKQTSLFQKLKYYKINLKVYFLLYKAYTGSKLETNHIQLLFTAGLMNNEFRINEQGVKIIKSIDKLFISNKNIKIEDLMGQDVEIHLDSYIKTFPTTKLPNGKYARGNKKNILTNFKWFFQNYDYDWPTILQATDQYVNEYRVNNYMYMRTALYFIRKDDGTRTVHSDLADYCEKIVNNDNFTEDKTFKTKIL
jgi:hypothetical protein